MSAAKRQKMLFGFGAVAVVLIAAIAFVSPNFRNEDARGAIGAVEKHRAPQIAQSDVVLGDEQTKQDHQIIYGDFLADAAALQSIAADMASQAQSVESRAQVAARSLDARYNDLRMRYQQYAVSALEAMDQLGVVDQLGRADFQDLSNRVNADLESADMEALAVRFASMAEQAESRSRLGIVSAQLESFSWGVSNLANAADVSALQNAFEADSLGLRLRVRAESLEAMAKEAKSIESASIALEAKSLDARALASLSADLLQHAELLEARAVKNMESLQAAQAATVEALGRMRQTIDMASQSLESRAADLDAKSVQEARTRLAAFRSDLESRHNDIESRSTVAMRDQLAAVDSHLEARSAVRNRANLASAMGDAGALAQRARALAAKAND